MTARLFTECCKCPSSSCFRRVCNLHASYINFKCIYFYILLQHFINSCAFEYLSRLQRVLLHCLYLFSVVFFATCKEYSKTLYRGLPRMLQCPFADDLGTLKSVPQPSALYGRHIHIAEDDCIPRGKLIMR